MKIGLKKFASLIVGLMVSGSSYGADKDIVDTAVASGNFKTLAAALKAGDLIAALKGEGPFTVFAPTDEAFAALPAGTVESLLKPENKSKLVAVLTYHVVPGKVMAADVVKLAGAKTLNGQRVDVKVSGSSVAVDQAKVIKADIVCKNGIIHVIDAVMLPASDTTLGIAEKAGVFKTLLAAVNAAGLSEVFSGPGPFTVFAPSDEAFAKLPKGALESLLLPENKATLVSLLKQHVTADRVFSEDALKVKEAKSLDGTPIHVHMAEGAVMINNAKLVTPDIDCSNGVIHVIDTVLTSSAG